MPYKRTGRPPGRPKTKEYVTLMARVPQDIADQAKQYASRKRQTISEVLRDGLDMLLQEARYASMVSDIHDTNGAPEIVSDTIKTARGIVSDTNNASESLAEALRMQRLRAIVSDTNGASESVPEMVSDMNSVSVPPATADVDESPLVVSVAIAPQSAQPALDYDPSKYVLGKLCPRGHDHNGTGQTLLTIGKRRCLLCEAAKKREKRAAHRQP